ncbi:hypothetical protein N7490_002938 [Penicillium lividum]|nr:hypothetical protein N7490_002938 [Penicillium lividum]
MAAARVLKSGDIVITTVKAEDTEFLIETSDQWLPRLPHGARAKIIPEMFSILVHGVPKNTFPRQSIVSGEARAIIFQDNGNCVPKAKILYTAWTGGRHSLRAHKPKGSLVVSFHHAEDANTLLREPFIIRGTLYRTELYDPQGQPTQCHRCQSLGHIQRGCDLPIRCSLCAEKHECTNYPLKNEPERYVCANCRGQHAASDRKCHYWIDESKKARQRIANKPTFFETPRKPDVPPTIVVSPQINPAPASAPNARRRPGRPRQQALTSITNYLPATPTPLIQGAHRNLQNRRTSGLRNSINAYAVDISDTDTQSSSLESSAASGPERSASDIEPEPSQTPSSEPKAAQSAASDSDPPARPSPFSSPRKRRSARLNDTDSEASALAELTAKRARLNHSTGHREIPQPTPEQRLSHRSPWSPGRKKRHQYLMAKKGLLGNRWPIKTPEEQAEADRVIRDAEAGQGQQATPTASTSAVSTPTTSTPAANTGSPRKLRPRRNRKITSYAEGAAV